METTTLGSLICLQRGYDLTEAQRRPGVVPVVGSAGVHGFHDTARAKGPGVALGRSGASFGKVSFVREDYWPHNTTIFVTDFKGNDPLFIRYLLESLDFSSLNSGSAQQSLNRNYVYLVPVNRFPLPIQRRIAGILSAYDELIENSQRRIKILESMARALYREWFVHFRFPGHESVPRVPSALGDIPKGWEVKSLLDLMDIRGGSQPPKSEFVYEPREGYVRLIQIRDYESDSHLTFVRRSSKLRMVERTEIMIARYGASVARICSGLSGAYNVALAKIIPTFPDTQEFLRRFVSDDEFQKLLIGMSGRAAQNGFNKADIAAVRVAIPTDEYLLRRFERFAVPIRDSILALRDQIQNLRRTRDLLLPRLFSGQIDVEALRP